MAEDLGVGGRSGGEGSAACEVKLKRTTGPTVGTPF